MATSRIAVSSLLVLFCQLLAACVAPGSAIGHLSVRGSLSSSSGEPLANREIEIAVPGTYGWLQSETARVNPEYFRRMQVHVTVTTNHKGQFSYDLGDRAYHVDVWIIPPLGALPRNPPPPFLFLRLPSVPGETYAVDTSAGRVMVVGESGNEIPVANSRASSVSATSESGFIFEKRSTTGVVNLTIRQP